MSVSDGAHGKIAENVTSVTSVYRIDRSVDIEVTANQAHHDIVDDEQVPHLISHRDIQADQDINEHAAKNDVCEIEFDEPETQSHDYIMRVTGGDRHVSRNVETESSRKPKAISHVLFTTTLEDGTIVQRTIQEESLTPRASDFHWPVVGSTPVASTENTSDDESNFDDEIDLTPDYVPDFDIQDVKIDDELATQDDETTSECRATTYYGPLNVVYEPLCDPNNLERTLHPITYPHLYAYNTKLEGSFWMADKVDYNDDPKDWRDNEKMDNNMRRVILEVLSYFARSEPIVREDACSGIGEIITDPSARAFFGAKAQNENVHDATYNTQIDVLCETEEERDQVRNAAKNSEVIKAKYDFAKRWYYNEVASLAMRIVAFIMIEGLHFSSSFSTILWYKMRGLLPGVCEGNDYIIRDEGIHWNYGVELHNTLQPANRISQDALYAVMHDAVELECSFARHLLREPLPGLLPDAMCDYVKSLACVIVTKLGHAQPYIVSNPFPWSETNNLSSKKNFFEKRGAEYKRTELSMNKSSGDFAGVAMPSYSKSKRAGQRHTTNTTLSNLRSKLHK